MRQRAQDLGGFGLTPEGFSWLLLRACGVNDTQLLQLLHPLQGRFPQTLQQYRELQQSLRRMGHILEHSPANIGAWTRRSEGRPQTTGYVQHAGDGGDGQAMQTFMTAPPDPWASQDPWSGSSLPGPAAQTSQPDVWAHYNQGAAYFGGTEDSGTDTETVSSSYTTVVDGPDLQGVNEAQVGELIFWNYQQSKSRGRAWAGKPVRRARRFMHRKGAFLAALTDAEVNNIFYTGGKGKPGRKGKRSSGKSFGRRKNRRGRDGQVMLCS